MSVTLYARPYDERTRAAFPADERDGAPENQILVPRPGHGRRAERPRRVAGGDRMSARTRRVLSLMRDAVDTVETKNPSDVVTVSLSRAYGRRLYMLSVVDGRSPVMYAGSPVMYDATRGTLWVRPGMTGLEPLYELRATGTPDMSHSVATDGHRTVYLP